MEIELNDDAHEATGAKLYLQLKSGDSYTCKRRSDGAEIFMLKKQRHAEYWMAQAFPVLLVIRNSEGEVRRMEHPSEGQSASCRWLALEDTDLGDLAGSQDPAASFAFQF